MKKKVLFCLAALGVSSMLFGFDSAETADSILEKMQAASADAESMTMDMDMNVNIAMNIGDGTTTSTLNMAVGGGFDIAANIDPLAMSMDGTMSISGLGANEQVSMKMYGVTDENNMFDVYTYQEDSTSGESGWTHSSSSLGDMNIKDLMTVSSNINYSEWGLNFELAPEAVDVDGTECYLLSAVMDSTSIDTLMKKSLELTGEELPVDDASYEMVMSMLGGLKINYDYYVDAATYLPVKFHMDLNGSDLSAISQFAAMAMGEMAEGSTFELVINDFSIDGTSTYGAPIDITVPEEAIASAAEMPEIAADALAESLSDMTDGTEAE